MSRGMPISVPSASLTQMMGWSSANAFSMAERTCPTSRSSISTTRLVWATPIFTFIV